MLNSEIIQHPILEVSINGMLVEAYPSKFTLSTQMGFPNVISSILYPADFTEGKTGDEIIVSLLQDDKKDLYFTGTIYSATTHGKYRELLLTDSFKKLCDTDFTAAYRKEKAANILNDILEAAGISETSITCPEVELARFSTQTIQTRFCIDLLINALAEHGEEGLFYFFDEKNVFHFGKVEDTGKNEGETFSFETNENILRSGSGTIEVLPCPIRHTQKVTINGIELLTVGTQLLVSRKLSRLVLFVREVS